MIQIYRSPSLDQLSARLAELIRKNHPRDPLEPTIMMVPNMDTARWLKLRLAGRNGISANIEALLPADWFWKQVRKIYPDLPEILPSDMHPMKWTLFELLSEQENRSRFPVIDRYVSRQPKQRNEQALFQLCGQIASVFDEYQVYRPEMLLRWQQGRKGEGDEKWQAELWQILNNDWKKRDHAVQANRPELLHEVMTALSHHEIIADDPLFIFNPGLLPSPIAKMIDAAGKHSDIFLFQIRLCSEDEKNRNEILQAYGRESISSDRVINSLDGKIASDLSAKQPGSSLLDLVQESVINDEPIGNIIPPNPENSGIEVRSCHSPLREIEVLQQFLLEAFEADESLDPDDVLVATPDLEAYRPYIRAVFGQSEDGLPDIPYHAGYASGNTGEGIERALIRLLSLIDSRFEFASVIDLFLMKPVYEAFGLSESEAEKVARWVEENNVVWGLDAEHRQEFDQPGDHLRTWETALRRGWYGHFLGGESGDMMDGLLLYNSIQNTNDLQTWAAFTSYLKRLSNMRDEMKRKRSCRQWADWLTAQMNLFFDEAAMEQLDSQRTIRLIGKIEEQSEAGDCSMEIPFSIFKGELTSNLNRQKASGALFTNGVTFSSMVPVRSIPFKIIALVGLNESTFPRKKSSADFDLMSQDPQPGERNRKYEDRNLFIESIMSAGEIHYCSYIGQSREDNEEIPPSTIVSEWVDILCRITGKEPYEIIQKESLTGYSPGNFGENRSFSKTYFQTALNVLHDEAAFSGMKLNRPIPPEETTSTIRLDDLVRFYGNPIQWFLRSRFEVYLKEAGRERDEFSLDHLESHLLFQRVFGWMLNGKPDRQIESLLIESGSVPSGWSGEKEVFKLKTNAETAISALRSYGIEPRQEVRQISLTVGENEIEGTLVSYAMNQMVDVIPSNFSGKVALGSWIRHLCASACNLFDKKKSILFCELKKGDPKLIKFDALKDPSRPLAELIDLYRRGLDDPQRFFPKTLYAFEETQRKRDGKDPYAKAANAFNGSDFHIGESNDLYIKTLLGANVEFSPDLIDDEYRQVISRMMDQMEND